MVIAIVVCIVYAAVLIGVQRASGVRYDQIAAGPDQMRRGVVVPVAVCTVGLVAYAAVTGQLASAFTWAPRADAWWLWSVPAVIAAGIVIRLVRAPWSSAGARFVLWALLGTALVGLSEELLVRGVLVHAIQDAGHGPRVVAVVSSVVFGLLHGVNVLNGQDPRTTAIQVAFTMLMGLALFVCLAVSGTLWLPIVLHFLFDFSLVVQGQVNKEDAGQTKAEVVLLAAMYLLPLAAIVVL